MHVAQLLLTLSPHLQNTPNSFISGVPFSSLAASAENNKLGHFKQKFIFVPSRCKYATFVSCITLKVASFSVILLFFFMLRPNAGHGLLILEVSRSHTLHTTVGRTPLDEWSARRRDLYLTAQNTHNRQTSMPPVGFEPTISAGERPQTYALDRAATGTSDPSVLVYEKWFCAETGIQSNTQ